MLSKHHGAFAWGNSSEEAVNNLEAMELIAKLAFYTVIIGSTKRISKKLINKHFFRKHGIKKYYGQ